MDLDRKIWAVYDLLENDQYDQALIKIEPLARKNPNRPFLVSLKAYILMKCGKQDEAVKVAYQAKALEPVDLGSLQNLAAIFRSAGKAFEALEMFEKAFQRTPNNEELAQKYMHLLIKEHQFKNLQAVALKMHRQFKAPQYWFWAIMCLVLQAEEMRSKDPEAFQKDISYTLAERYLLKAGEDKLIKGYEELYLYYLVYMGQGKLDEALKLLDGPLAQTGKIAPKIRDLRLGLLERLGKHTRAKDIAAQIIEEDIDNWTAYLAYISAVLAISAGEKEVITEAREFLDKLVAKSLALASPKRGPFLAQLELASRNKDEMLGLVIGYLERFGAKSCAFEDLVPYLTHIAYESSDDQSKLELKQHLASRLEATKIEGLPQKDAVRNTTILSNLLKMERFLTPALPENTLDLHSKANHLMELYLHALPLGDNLVKTEKQYSDDFALLAAHYLLDAPNDNALQAALLLEYAISKSPHNFHLKFLLVRVYHLLGAYQRPLDVYASLDVKHVQNDTLSHLVVDSGASLGHYAQAFSACHTARNIYMRNRAETPEMIAKAFQHNTFSKIQEFIKFQARLETSLQRRVTDLELMRCELLPYSSSLESWVNLLNSVPDAALAVTSALADNRDFDVLLSFTPNHLPQLSVENLTLLLPRRSANWVALNAQIFKMLKTVSNPDCTPAEIDGVLSTLDSFSNQEGFSQLEAQLLQVVPSLLRLSQFIFDESASNFSNDALTLIFQACVEKLEEQFLKGCSGHLLVNLAACIEALTFVSLFCRLLGSPACPRMLCNPERSSYIAKELKERILKPFLEQIAKLLKEISSFQAPSCKFTLESLQSLPERNSTESLVEQSLVTSWKEAASQFQSTLASL